jgi:hypothetical protein
VCSNGLVIGKSKIEISERHQHDLELSSIGERLHAAFEAVEADRSMMKRWQLERVSIDDIEAWANEKVSEQWGKKAAMRVYHI